nr:MAG TPA: Integrase [Caudoviricetes sp.]
MSTKCKSCKREVPDNAPFCPWCGKKQIKEKKSDGVIKVPEPEQLPSGNWRIYLRAEKQSVTESTKEKCITRAKAIRAGFIEEHKRIPKNALTLRQAIEAFMSTNENALSPATIRGYDIICRHRFPEKIDEPLEATTGWQEAIDAARKKYSPKTVYNSWGLVREIMTENNITPPKVRLPQKRHAEKEWLTYDQISSFLDALKGKRCESGALFALHSLRRSEIFGLSWDDIDLKKGRIHVRGAMVQDKNNVYIKKKETKNTSSTRTIRIMIPRLKEVLNRQKDTGLSPVLSTPNSLTQSINRVCAAANLPEIGTHGLRHSFASLGFHLGLSELEVQEIGGWRDHNTVHKIYLHLAKQDRLNAENKMEEFYKGGGEEVFSEDEQFGNK